MSSASVDGTIVIWNAVQGSCIAALSTALQQTIKTLAFSVDGTKLASGGYNNQINTWKLIFYKTVRI